MSGPDEVTMEYAERSIVGMLLADPSRLVYLGNLKPEQFTDPDLGSVYRVILATRADGLVMVGAELRKRGTPLLASSPSWGVYLSSIVDDQLKWMTIDENLPRYADLIIAADTRRRLARLKGGDGAR